MRRCALRADGLLAPPPQLAQLTKAEQQKLARMLQQGLNLQSRS